MPEYEQGRRGRKPTRTAEQKYMKKKEWEMNNPENVWHYRRTEMLKRCMERGGFPKMATVEKYQVTEEELREIADVWGIDIELPDED